MLKRMLPRARGSASPIEKKMSHVTLVLGVNQEQKASRFTIAAPKKKKTTGPSADASHKHSAKKPAAKPAQEGEKKAENKNKKQGGAFWKRTFNRKAMGGE